MCFSCLPLNASSLVLDINIDSTDFLKHVEKERETPALDNFYDLCLDSFFCAGNFSDSCFLLPCQMQTLSHEI